MKIVWKGCHEYLLPFLVNAVIFTHPVIKRGWSNLGNRYCMFVIDKL